MTTHTFFFVHHSLSKHLIENFTRLCTTKSSEVPTWSDTMALLFNSLAEIRLDQFLRHIPVFYTSIVSLLSFELAQSVREGIKYVLIRTGSVFNLTSDSFKQ